MKILLVSNMYPSSKHPSYGTFVKNSKGILESKGMDVKVSVMTKKNSKWGKAAGYLWFYLASFVKTLFRRYDIVYVHYPSLSAPPVIAASWFRSVHLYVNTHGSDVLAKNKKQRLVNSITSIAVKKAEKVLCPSSYFKKIVEQKYNLAPEKVAVFASGGVNSKTFSPNYNREDAINEFNLSVPGEYVGFIGRLEPGKGWNTYLETMRKLTDRYGPRVKGIVIGDGSQRNLFHERVSELNLCSSIIHFEALSPEKLGRLMSCFDVFCFPTESESLGLVGIEALASGVPVVGSDISVLRSYIVHGKNGFLAEKNNPDSFYKSIIAILDMEEYEYESMKTEAVKTAEPFYQEHIEKDFINIFTRNN
ncbi:glycosyltransferase family 4 protein [Marinococcus halophilus]|uniref:glycosyltransferase family 4 protein n=1 Tax=Marinococcus halophilus TaxID=1371 RepID=UPI0009A7BB74|nr:glycosyltransferase family 4 protein [Marinococcus halophilus]